MSDGRVTLTMAGGIAAVTIERPAARNAMTFAMYAELAEACAVIAAEPGLRVATFRGAGAAFVAGTAIDEFTAFAGAEDGLRYEERVEAVIGAVETLPVPTVAAISGPAVGGGLVLAAACDFRIAVPEARFGAPIARTVGNCLSAANTERLAAGFGAARVKRMLMLAELIGAEEARACGFLLDVAAADQLDARLAEIAARLAGHAPITMRVAKETLRRLAAASLPDDEDLVRAAYGSRDFAEGVAAFLAKRPPDWQGR